MKRELLMDKPCSNEEIQEIKIYPKISVLMPVYNTKEEFLREAIDSILNQTYTDFELIILNDGSTNNVEEVINSYKDSRIRYYINDVNLGLPKTRNKLIDFAEGEYIANMDSDDISLPERFAKQVAYLDRHHDVSLISANMVIYPDIPVRKNPEQVSFLSVLKGCYMINALFMFRKADFETHNLQYDQDYKYAEDYELLSRVIRVLKCVNLHDVLYKYRYHNNQSSSKYKKDQKKFAMKARYNMFKYLAIDKDLQKQIAFSFNNLEIIFLLKIAQIQLVLSEFFSFKFQKNDNVARGQK